MSSYEQILKKAERETAMLAANISPIFGGNKGNGIQAFNGEVQTTINALTGLNTLDKNTINVVISEWILSGVWDELDGIWVLADGQFINWKNPGTYDASENGIIHKIKWNGIKTDESTGYINLNYNPQQNGVKFTQNSASFGAYVIDGKRSGSARLMGGTDGTYYLTVSPQNAMHLRFNGNVGQALNQVHSYSVFKLWAFNRTSPTNVEWYVQGVKVADLTLPTAGIPDCNMYAMVFNNNGVANYFSKNAVAMMWFGGVLTELQVLSLQTGIDYLISSQKRLDSGINMDLFTYEEGHVPYGNCAYRVGTNIYHVWWKTTGVGDTTRPVMIEKIDDNGNISISYQVGGSIAGASDEHLAPYLTIDNNGYIYVSKELGNPTHISPIQVFKSNNPLDITGGFTRINLFSGDFSYPYMLKTGDKIIMAARSSSLNVKIWTKGLTDSAFAEVSNLCNDPDGRNYPYPIKNIDEDIVWFTVQINTNVGGHANFRKIYVLQTTDGITWSNVNGSFSKNITVAALSKAELETNYLLTSVTSPNVVFCSGAFIDSNGMPRLLVEEATENVLSGWRDTHTLATYHYNGGWVRRVARTGLSMESRHDKYMHNSTYLTYNDNEYIIFSYKNGDPTILEKWISTDFITWTFNKTWLNGNGLKIAWPDNDVQNTKTVGKNMLFVARFDPNLANNIDDFCVENIKRF